jgi:hypothetical protein
MPPEWIVERRKERRKALLLSFGGMTAALAILLGILHLASLDIAENSWTRMELVKPRRGHARVETDVRFFAQLGYWIRHHKVESWAGVVAICGAVFAIQTSLRRNKRARKYLYGTHLAVVLIAGAVFTLILIQTLEIRHGIQ